jgi:methyl-accepting chemotaxis protein
MFHTAAESSERVSTLITEIATASDEQATGIEEINRAVTEIDKVTQSNAAGAEETASASEELTAQAAAMDDVVTELEGMVGIKSDEEVSVPVPDQSIQKIPSSRKKTTQPPAKQMLPASEPKKESKKPTSAEEAIPFDDDDFQDF